MMPGASVYLVNPMTGERVPIIAHFRADRTNTIGINRLDGAPRSRASASTRAPRTHW